MLPLEEPQETTINLDVPDERDYLHEDLFGNLEELPESVLYLPEHIQNQWAKTVTRMACSRFGLCHAINGQNKAVQEKDGMRYFELPAKMYWEQYLVSNPPARFEGATLQSALNQFLKLWFITWYSRVHAIQDMKYALSKVRLILTGSKNGNWVSVRDKKIYAVGNWPAHIFAIVGYDKTGWRAINSYWPNNGLFHIAYELTDTLFTRYAISDSRDEKVFRKFK